MEEIKTALIFGSMPQSDWSFLSIVRKQHPFVIAADGGVSCAYDAGFTPDLFIGDCDSSISPPENIQSVILPCDKDLTDLQACFVWALDHGYKRIVITACSGGRQDQQLAAIGLLERAAENQIDAVFIDQYNWIQALLPGEHRVSRLRYHYFSLIPLDSVLEKVTIKGAKYALDHRDLYRGDSLTISNEFSDDSVSISIHSGRCLLVLSEPEVDVKQVF